MWERGGYTVTSWHSLLEDRVEALQCPLTLVQAVLAEPLEGIQLLLIILDEEKEGGKHSLASLHGYYSSTQLTLTNGISFPLRTKNHLGTDD